MHRLSSNWTQIFVMKILKTLAKVWINVTIIALWCFRSCSTSSMMRHTTLLLSILVFIKLYVGRDIKFIIQISIRYIYPAAWGAFIQHLILGGRYVRLTSHWCHYERDGVSNHQPRDCLLKRIFRRRLKKTSKLHVTGLCAGNSPVTGEFPAQMASNAENVSIWWRHHVYNIYSAYASQLQIRPQKLVYNIFLYYSSITELSDRWFLQTALQL